MMYEKWMDKFPAIYKQILEKKCSNYNCLNIKANGKNKCPRCLYGESVRMCKTDIAIYRYMIETCMSTEEAKLLNKFNKENHIKETKGIRVYVNPTW